MLTEENDRRIHLSVSLPFLDETFDFLCKAIPGEKYHFSIRVADSDRYFVGRIAAKVYRYDPRNQVINDTRNETDFVGYCEFVGDAEPEKTDRINAQIFNGQAELAFFVPSDLRGTVEIDFELFDNEGRRINNDRIDCETNFKRFTTPRIEIENLSGEEQPKDEGEPKVAPAPPVNPSEIPPTDISSAVPSNTPPTVVANTQRRSQWYVPALIMASVLAIGFVFVYLVYTVVTDWPDEETQVAMIDDEEEAVGLIQLPMDVPDTQNSEEEIAESVPSVISLVPVRDLEVVSLATEEIVENPMPVQVVAPEPPEQAPVVHVCPNLDDEMREKTEIYIHAVSALNAEVDLATGQRDDAIQRHVACTLEYGILASANKRSDAPVIIVDSKKEEIIPLNFPKRAVKPKGEPLVLEDLEGIPTFDTMTMSEKRIFLRLHNKTFNK